MPAIKHSSWVTGAEPIMFFLFLVDIRAKLTGKNVLSALQPKVKHIAYGSNGKMLVVFGPKQRKASKVNRN
ncbi:hypothetical protein [Lactobacillus crispatus]|uniref:hypothetical protein n=1 Tax=Lactobacillus crispatus TaxID=47770 RepID=UPI0030FAC15F